MLNYSALDHRLMLDLAEEVLEAVNSHTRSQAYRITMFRAWVSNDEVNQHI